MADEYYFLKNHFLSKETCTLIAKDTIKCNEFNIQKFKHPREKDEKDLKEGKQVNYSTYLGFSVQKSKLESRILMLP